MSDQDLEEAIEREIDAVPALAGADIDGKLVQSAISDIAEGIYPYLEIAARYGTDLMGLYRFLRLPGVVRRVKERRAIWQSSESVLDRGRRYYGIVALEAAPKLDKLIHDAETPPALRLEAIEKATRSAGLYTSGSGPRADGHTGPTAAQFAVNITFSNGERASITTVVPPAIEGQAA